MERLYAHICSLQAAFQKAPEIFQPVRVDLPTDIFDSVINDLVLIVAAEAMIAAGCVGVEVGARRDDRADFCVQNGLTGTLNDASPDAARGFAAPGYP